MLPRLPARLAQTRPVPFVCTQSAIYNCSAIDIVWCMQRTGMMLALLFQGLMLETNLCLRRGVFRFESLSCLQHAKGVQDCFATAETAAHCADGHGLMLCMTEASVTARRTLEGEEVRGRLSAAIEHAKKTCTQVLGAFETMSAARAKLLQDVAARVQDLHAQIDAHHASLVQDVELAFADQQVVLDAALADVKSQMADLSTAQFMAALFRPDCRACFAQRFENALAEAGLFGRH